MSPDAICFLGIILVDRRHTAQVLLLCFSPLDRLIRLKEPETEVARPLFGDCDRVRFACLLMYSDSIITDTSTGRVFFKFKCSRYITKRRIVSKLLLSEKMSYPYLISIFFR